MAQNHRRRGAVRAECTQRRARASLAPAPVIAPVLAGLALQVLVVFGGVLLGVRASVIAVGVLGVGIAVALVARRTVGSLLVGAGLRLAQPYTAGERVRVYVASLGSVEDAEVVRVGPANTTLMTRSGLVVVPNNRMFHRSSQRPPRVECGKTITRA